VAAPCGASTSSREPAPATIRFVVIRHDRRPHYPPLPGSPSRWQRPTSPWLRSSPNTRPIVRPRIPAPQIARWIAQLARSIGPLTSTECLADARRAQARLLCNCTGCTIAIAPTTPRLRSIRLL
jgi:hypothetical protein